MYSGDDIENLLLSEIRRLSELINGVEELKSKNIAFCTKIGELETQANQIDEYISDQNDRISEYQNVIERINKTIDDLKDQYLNDDIVHKVNTLYSHKKELNKDSEKINLDLSDIRKSIDTLSIIVHNQNENISYLQAGLKSIDDNYNIFGFNYRNLKEKVDKMNKSTEITKSLLHSTKTEIRDEIIPLKKNLELLSGKFKRYPSRIYWTFAIIIVIMNLILNFILVAKVFLKIDLFQIIY